MRQRGDQETRGLLLNPRYGWQDEVKAGARAFMCGHPEPPRVIFDDGSADRKPHAESARLRRMECLEDVLDALRPKPNPRVTDGNLHFVVLADLRADHELTAP